ncbi:MAG: HAD family hydrolase, partial [Bariatricus sp.]
MRRVEALIFDMDGLIFDSERVVQRSWNEAGTELGYGRVGEQIYHTLGFNVKQREVYFKSIYGEDFPMEEFSNLTRKIFYEIAESEGITMKKGVRELMDFAKARGIQIGLATSSRREYSVRLLT